MDTYKKINLAVFAVMIVMGVGAFAYSKLICQKYGCELGFGKNILFPLEAAGFILSVFLLGLLFLPSHYFRSWLMWICSWAVPIMFVFVLGATGRGLDFSRSEMIEFLTPPFAIITVLFITGRFLWLRRKNRSKM
jgi:hypothetical protein